MGVAALPELREALKDADASVRWRAVQAISQIGEAALADLQEALKDPDSSVREAAAAGLEQMGKAALPALPELREALKDPDGDVQWAAASALGQMGEAAVSALPELRELLKHLDGDMRSATARAIIMILANSSSEALLKQKNMGRLMDKLISTIRIQDYMYWENWLLSTALQVRDRLWLKQDQYRDPWLPPPLSHLERVASFAGYFLSMIVLLSLAGVLAVLSGSAGKVLGDQVTEGIKKVAADHPIWMLVVVVGLLAAAAGLLNFFLLDRIKGRLKRR
jgi:hypothetical protein